MIDSSKLKDSRCSDRRSLIASRERVPCCFPLSHHVGVNHEDNCKADVEAYINYMKEKHFFK